MRRRFSTSTYIIFTLITIGIFSSIIHSINSYLIPIIVFGLIFLLYKFPPNQWRGMHKKGKTTYTFKAKPNKKKKHSPFRVIDGNKNFSDDDAPKFH